MAFVIGNGRSRLDLDLTVLSQFKNQPIYGCNALYRDFKPDFLVSVDIRMIEEYARLGIDKTHTIFTTYHIQTPGNFNYFPHHPGKNSGHSAMKLANIHNHQQVYTIGFDYIGLPNGKVNNVYSDTFNYAPSTNPATAQSDNWYIELRQVLQEHPQCHYIRVVGNDHFVQKRLPHTITNFSEITMEEFKNVYYNKL